MTFTIIYFILLLLLTVYFVNKRANVLGKMILILYTFIAFVSFISLKDGIIDESGITLIPYIFLVVSYFIFFSPFLVKETKCGAKKIVGHVDVKYIIFAYIYIICAIVAIKCYFPSVINLLSSGDWALNRTALYSGDLNAPYSNRLEYYAIQFSGYFRILAIIVGFSLLRFDNREHGVFYSKMNRLAGILTIVTSMIYVICTSIFNSARGTLFNVFVLVIAIYLFFYYEIEKNKRRFFLILGGLIIAAIAPYVIQVTISRFGSGDAADSVISYFGQAPIVFNKYVFPLEKHAWGKYGFSHILGFTFTPESIGGQWGASFFTFVGWICIDWGPIGVLLIGGVVSYFIKKFINKAEYQISDIFLVFTYYQVLTNGVFVIGASYIYTLIGSIIIFILLKIFIENRRYKFGNITF